MLDITDESSNHTSEISSLVNKIVCPEPSCESSYECPDRYLCKPTFDFCFGYGYCVPGCDFRPEAKIRIKPCPAGETCYYKPGDGDFRYSHKHTWPERILRSKSSE